MSAPSRTPTPAVILAAGASSRMGRPKALLCLPEPGPDGVPLTFLEALVRALGDAGCAPVVVVTGACPLPMPPGATPAYAADWAEGMRSSLRAGLAATPDGPVLLTHVDRPRVAPETLRVLLAVPPEQTALPVFAGRDGHPVRLSAPLRRRLLAPDATPLDEVLRTLVAEPAAVVRIAVDDPDVLLNINTPADLARLARLRAGGDPPAVEATQPPSRAS